MKTKFNNIVKRTLSGIALAALIFVSAGSLKAQSFGGVFAMATPNSEIVNSLNENFAYLEEAIEEAPLEIENWMSNNNFWGFSNEALEEEAFEVEPWMSSSEFWGVSALEEEPLEIEAWMSSESYWTGNAYEIRVSAPEEEAPITLENWMHDEAYWGVK